MPEIEPVRLDVASTSRDRKHDGGRLGLICCAVNSLTGYGRYPGQPGARHSTGSTLAGSTAMAVDPRTHACWNGAEYTQITPGFVRGALWVCNLPACSWWSMMTLLHVRIVATIRV